MSIEKETTEKLIKDTAMELFFGRGFFKATTQEIADAAGVNRTSINYYFRSRDNLFETVFKEAIQRMQTNRRAIATSDLPFRQKIEQWIDDELVSAIKYPFLEIYIVTEMVANNNHIEKDKQISKVINDKLAKELEAEIQKGAIKPIDPIHFILNVASLVSFPSCLRPLLMDTLQLSDRQFNRILKERKQVILNTIFN